MRRLIMTALCCAGALLLLQGRAPAEQPDRKRDYDLAVERALLDREVDAYLTATAAAGEPAPNEFEFHWSKGIRFDSHDGNFRFKLGGRIMVDTVFQDGNDPLETIAAATGQTDPQQVDDDRIFFRRVRLYVSGTIHRNVFFKAQFDFAKSSETEFKDLYIGLKDIAVVGHVRFGNQFEPHGLEMNTSSKYITFIERSMPTGAFGRERRVGVLFYDAVMEREGVRRLYWAVGVFRPTETASGDLSSEDGYELTFRITGLPLHRSGSEGVTLLHVGFSFQYRTPEDGTIRFRSRGPVGRGPRLIDTGDLAADSAVVLGFEFAGIWRSWSVQAELFLADVAGMSAGDPEPSLSGFYVQVSWWPTGEQRRFEDYDAHFGRVTPKRDFHDGSGGSGAVELAFRIEITDLSDDGIDGGEADSLVFGVNWHWNPNTRVMVNYTHVEVDQGGEDGDLDAVVVRVQVDF